MTDHDTQPPPDPDDPTNDPSYQHYIDAAAEHCRCCPNCWSHPCDGSLAGGICDHMKCRCDEHMYDDGEWDDDDEDDDC